jgi:choline kinase
VTIEEFYTKKQADLQLYDYHSVILAGGKGEMSRQRVDLSKLLVDVDNDYLVWYPIALSIDVGAKSINTVTRDDYTSDLVSRIVNNNFLNKIDVLRRTMEHGNPNFYQWKSGENLTQAYEIVEMAKKLKNNPGFRERKYMLVLLGNTVYPQRAVEKVISYANKHESDCLMGMIGVPTFDIMGWETELKSGKVVNISNKVVEKDAFPVIHVYSIDALVELDGKVPKYEKKDSFYGSLVHLDQILLKNGYKVNGVELPKYSCGRLDEQNDVGKLTKKIIKHCIALRTKQAKIYDEFDE